MVATDYAIKWAKVIATKNDDANIVAKFLFENILSRSGCPKESISEGSTHFLNETIEELTTKFLITHKKTSPYHLRVYCQIEKTNGLLCKISTKTIADAAIDWDKKL